jgi:squalene-hopene/tetraprenyl-beta-curcumene cyclase
MKAGSRRSFLGQALSAAGLLGLSRQPANGEVDSTSSAAELETKAVNFLRPRQGDDGGWSRDSKEPGVTGLVVTALLRSGRVTPDDAAIAKALGYLERFLGPKGGLSEAPHSVYATSVAIMAFQVANKGGRHDRIIKGGQEFLKSTQWDETENKGRETDFYGGAGYGGRNSRPDLSNTSFMMEALRNTGLPADDPALQKALVFVSRCQNLKAEFNDQPWAGKVNDGGFIYTAANRGSSVAGKAEDGGLRSSGSMTYAGLRSMIYAGLTADDPRVKAAQEFIRTRGLC